jgi:(1->4)-alpha-D-glucan 1-alpha-D-glucosylmutase
MRIPTATYRLQFSPDFGFKQAQDIISYLNEIGISDIYASPIFKAREGSHHGYDVVDMNQLNPDLGSANDFERLVRRIKKDGMGWIQDFVPNHMAFDGENKMLMDVLENGQHSEYFDFFDIEWDHLYESLSERLLAPFLGRHYSESLDAREINLQYDNNGFFITYYSLKLPLKIESYVRVLTHRLNGLRKQLGDDHPDMIKFLGILYSLTRGCSGSCIQRTKQLRNS